MLYTNDRVTIRFDGGIEVSRPWLEEDGSRAQRVLRNHAKERARCLCKPRGIPMHVVCRDGKFHLATMPGRAHHHSLSCPSYRPDPETSGLRHYGPEALSGSDRLRRIKVAQSDLHRPPFSHFSPSAALQLLWEAAGLNLCTPKIIQKRNYYVSLKSLQEISPYFKINDVRLRLFLPLLSTDAAYASHVIGQVGGLRSGRYGNAITLSGDRKHTFWIDRDQWDTSPMAATFGAFETPQFVRRIFLFARVYTTKYNNFRLFDVGLLPVSPQFLPLTHIAQQTLDKLIDDERRFYICQRFDATSDDSIPAAMLVDRDAPQPIFCPGAS